MKFLNGITDKYIGSFNGFYVNKLKNILEFQATFS